MFEYFSILLTLVALPLLGILILFFIPDTNPNAQKTVGLCTSLLTFLISILLWVQFDMSTPKYQFVEKFFSVPYSNMHIYLGVDGISLFFVLLTNLVHALQSFSAKGSSIDLILYFLINVRYF